MLYAQRDTEGKIIGLFDSPNEHATDQVSPSSEEVVEFLLGKPSSDNSQNYLAQTDLELIRVIEDLVELLMEKNLILLTDLPKAAQEKLLNRKQIRETAQGDDKLLIDEDQIF